MKFGTKDAIGGQRHFLRVRSFLPAGGVCSNCGHVRFLNAKAVAHNILMENGRLRACTAGNRFFLTLINKEKTISRLPLLKASQSDYVMKWICVILSN